jgi:gluconate 2-dehydrogenase gamma chain
MREPEANSKNARGISRRDILRNLAAGAAGGTVLRVIPVKAAELAHEMIVEENAAAGKYTPKFFPEHQYQTLLVLCDAIIPKDDVSGGAVEARAPEFIDLLSSENESYQATLSGGLMWLDNFCADRYQHTFLECTPDERNEVLDLIAFRKNAASDSTLSPGIAFFGKLRRMTCDGFYTAKIGIEDLKYIGNTALAQFPGCPPLPE